MWQDLRGYLDEIFSLALPGVQHVRFVGGLIGREASRRPDGGRVSVSGKGFTAETALSGCMGEMVEYLSFLERPQDPLVAPATAGCKAPARPWIEGRADAEELKASGQVRCRLLRGGAALNLPVPLVLRRPGDAAALEQTSSNGLGAGRTLKAAQAHAALELVERHSVLGWWWTQSTAPDIAPATVHAALPGIGLDGGCLNRCPGLWFKNLTGALGVPVAGAFTAASVDAPVACGFAAGFSLAQAIVGAYLEMRHAELGYRLELARPHSGRPGQTSLMPCCSAHRCLRPGTGSAAVPDPISGLAELAERCAARRVQLAWADLTRADLGVPVVRVIADDLQGPGTAHIVPAMRRRLEDAGLAEDDIRSLPLLY